ncbi:hypothetical protein BDV97DRAFT_166618 [Delphinella strobiligena]|nr:hypothetical protein BDV97DRAFT_166618 [Delphinella strobiligena]
MRSIVGCWPFNCIQSCPLWVAPSASTIISFFLSQVSWTASAMPRMSAPRCYILLLIHIQMQFVFSNTVPDQEITKSPGVEKGVHVHWSANATWNDFRHARRYPVVGKSARRVGIAIALLEVQIAGASLVELRPGCISNLLVIDSRPGRSLLFRAVRRLA